MLVKLIAKFAPWLSPIPTAYFVARSSVAHLATPLEIAIIIGVVLELLGVATVHTALNLYRWNIKPACNKEKGAWEKAPLNLAIAACGVYFGAVLLLSVFLETFPSLAAWAAAVFPFVSLTGMATLAIIYQHEERVAKYIRKDARMVGANAVYYAIASRIITRINGKAAHEMPALPASTSHNADTDTIDTCMICELCGQEVHNGNMGSHRRWHCAAAMPADGNGSGAEG